ncbi:MAG: hypothetical protein MZV63_44685 [Marinilabiliales bacterium]|nr:hypothetical protein [Marinilabiliales bacterium]
MAETSAWFTKDPEWQKKYANLTIEEIQKRQEILNTYAPASIRYSMIGFLVEIELYLNPDKPYDEIQKEMARKYLLIETDNIRTRGLNDIIYVSYPLYLQNYLLADIIACQIHKTLKEKFGPNYAFNKDVGKYLRNFYMDGEYFTIATSEW